MRAVTLLTAFALAAVCAPSSAADERYAGRLGELVNRYRVTLGLRELAFDKALATLAREHSAEMAKRGRLDHAGYQSRFGRSGYTLCVENVGWNYHTPQAQLDAWRNSSGHDRNLRDARVVHMGAGEASGYVTWIACR